ncbi:magnesium-translocating P-type ATPase [Thermogemmatispora aurantia]|uniref:magnesium-translocating P-type ATPase n=2 Tax=Thermogemmatispora TaxID=768669 RepID=UPI00124C7705|nr:magnesium-translocating P-type ATPase [Thermogemmatispora aurantia]GER84531.1 magnesium-translocating P-type ATPase [Thermogemmatispora aurantia]
MLKDMVHRWNRAAPVSAFLDDLPLQQALHGDLAQTLRLLNASLLGLTDAEAARRLQQVGPHQLPDLRARPWWRHLLLAFWNPFLMMLAGLGLASFLCDLLLTSPAGRSWLKDLLLAAMLVCSGGLRFWQERRAEQTIRPLTKTMAEVVQVMRRTHEQAPPTLHRIPLEKLVPGDLILLEEGRVVPADVRLVNAQGLLLDQSLFTGEAMPVEKNDSEHGEPPAPRLRSRVDRSLLALLDAPYLGLMGCSVVRGKALALVVATGRATVFSKAARYLLRRPFLSALQHELNQVSKVLLVSLIMMVACLLLMRGLARGDWSEAILFALAVGVGFTPEMLPLVVTVALARGAVLLAQLGLVVKQLPVTQALGALEILCLDKTGTLTGTTMRLVTAIDAAGQEQASVLRLAALSVLAQQRGTAQGHDPFAQAILTEARRRGIRLQAGLTFGEVLPFDPIRKRASAIVSAPDEGASATQAEAPALLLCQGSFEPVLAVASAVETSEGLQPLSEVSRLQLKRLARWLQERGLRVLAVAYKPVDPHHISALAAEEQELIFAGLLGLSQTLREGVCEGMEALRASGISLKLVTGDDERLAERLGEEVGFTSRRVLLGWELEGLSEGELAMLAGQTEIFASMTPLQKAMIVRVFQRQGSVVGYLGDGLNDLPALRRADIGLAVNGATESTQAAATVLMQGGPLQGLASGVRVGRRVSRTIGKYLAITISSNFGNALSILLASLFLPFLPMLPVQLLAQNMLYDLTQLSLAWDHLDDELLQQPHRWRLAPVLRLMLIMGPLSSLFDVLTFLLLWWGFDARSVAHAALFQSGWFLEGLFSQILAVHLLRTHRVPFLHSRAALPLLLASGGALVVGFWLPMTRLGTLLGLVPLPPAYFCWLLLILSGYCLLTELTKRWYLRRFGGWL